MSVFLYRSPLANKRWGRGVRLEALEQRKGTPEGHRWKAGPALSSSVLPALSPFSDMASLCL